MCSRSQVTLLVPGLGVRWAPAARAHGAPVHFTDFRNGSGKLELCCFWIRAPDLTSGDATNGDLIAGPVYFSFRVSAHVDDAEGDGSCVGVSHICDGGMDALRPSTSGLSRSLSRLSMLRRRDVLVGRPNTNSGYSPFRQQLNNIPMIEFWMERERERERERESECYYD